jgi:thiopurine S-methyltransferase
LLVREQSLLGRASIHEAAAHLIEITDRAPQLLISYDYDQSLVDGPPFSVSNEEVNRLYRDSYDLTPLASVEVVGGLKGKCPARENVWLLKRRKVNRQ